MGSCISSEKKVIAVVGATGSQGGGLMRAILKEKDGEFTVRALTRDPSKVRTPLRAVAIKEL
jgi:uncharacterized protein YbjT (DUF2867 family)